MSSPEKTSGKISAESASAAQDRPAPRILSAREIEVLELVACGLSAKEIAEELSLSTRTVERHLDNVRGKLRARNRPHLVRQAIELGEIDIRTK